MLDLGLANVTMFFMIIGISIIFVIAWMIKSESKINLGREEMKRLKGQVEAVEREKFALMEKIASIQNSPDKGRTPTMVLGQNAATLELRIQETTKKNRILEDENKKLKEELSEAKSSLEEVYKALSSS